MTRQEKYPDTKYFHYYNRNPKNRITSDCVVRAISTATGIPYETVVKEMAELWIQTGYEYSDLTDKYLQSKGWKKHKQPRHDDNTKLTGMEFCGYCETYSNSHFIDRIVGNVVANIGSHHIVAFVQVGNGQYKCYDIWNSTGGKVGNYWYRTED